MSISCAVLMCHAPIVIPQIAGIRQSQCATTTRAMREAARALMAHEPALVVLISPHLPRRPDSWGIVRDRELTGSFARFGHPNIALRFPGDPHAAEEIARAAYASGLRVHSVRGDDLDHGALVPLYFVREAGYMGPVIVVGLPYPGHDTEVLFGEVVRDAAHACGQRWAVLASGDMSHRLTPDAPSGYHARAAHFDQAFVECVRAGDLRGAIGLDADLIDIAGEDVVQSTAVAAGAVRFSKRGAHVFAYEGPFGVGYMEALLYSDHAEIKGRTPPRALARIALDAIEHELRGEHFVAPTLDPPWHDARGVFVTLRGPDGELRGCIGRTEPAHSILSEEVADCAVAAATRDYRMPPVELHELPSLSVEVSVLDDPEPVENRAELDPKHYGLVVSRGLRRGVLLPDVEGIDSVEEQLRIALKKGGIDPSEPFRLERFTVRKIKL